MYLGEFAAHIRGRRTNMETSLSEALYLTAVERNGDVVRMTSYAPLLARENHTRWNPNLIYFNNAEVKPTVDYYVQKLYGQNSDNRYVPSGIILSNNEAPVRKRIGVSVVQDDANGDLILKLVNLLPIHVNTTIDLSPCEVSGYGTLTVLQGEPSDEKALPVEKNIKLSGNFNYRVPRYSFNVIRIKTR